jgi:hypothetical protein
MGPGGMAATGRELIARLNHQVVVPVIRFLSFQPKITIFSQGGRSDD